MRLELDVEDIVFDLGGVLIDWDPRHLFCVHLGVDRPRVDEFLRTVCTPEWHAQLDLGRPFAQGLAELEQRFPQHRDWIRCYGQNWERMFAGEHAESVEVLEELARRGHRLHALSNYPAEGVAFLYRTFPFMCTFHTVILSGLLRVAKPDRAIFEYLLGRIGRRPCLFIDDRPENVEAARRCGLQAMQYAAGNGAGSLRAALSL